MNHRTTQGVFSANAPDQGLLAEFSFEKPPHPPGRPLKGRPSGAASWGMNQETTTTQEVWN